MERIKKKLCGRALKRVKYNRRILAVNPNDKRKLGPNAGSGKKDAK